MKLDFENYFRRDRGLDRSKGFMISLYARHPYLARIYREIRKLPKGARVLDLGAGEGHFLEIARRMRPDLLLVAADLSRCLVYEGLKDVPFVEFDLDAGEIFPELDGFDMVVSQHVLEHLDSPAALFHNAFRALKDGGVLYVECPDVRWTLLPHVPWLTGHRGGFNFWDDPTHRRPYTRPSLRKLGESAGFVGIRTFYVRKWGHLLALPMAIASRDDDYKAAVLHPLLGLWCGLLARKQS
jgi:SAM-dependent methyltransferase